MLISFQLVFRELPPRIITKYYASFLDAIFHILNITNEQMVAQVEIECKKTLDMLLGGILKLYSNPQQESRRDASLFDNVMDKILSNFFSLKTPARQTGKFYFSCSQIYSDVYGGEDCRQQAGRDRFASPEFTQTNDG
jgi:hypothetical protein